MGDILDTFEECKKRWAIEKDTNNVFFRYPEWLKEMPEPLADIINSLMSGFDYYSHQNVNKRLLLLHEELQKISDVEFENTIYCVLTNKNGRINRGYEYLIEYKYLNKLSKNMVYPNLKETPEWILNNIQNIVFVDDFCGSGKTFTDYMKKVSHLIQGKHIYYLVIHIMEESIEVIKQYGLNNNLNIHILYRVCTPKAFERNLQPVEQREKFKELSIAYGLPKKKVLGHEDTEALVAFYNDTPNNTLEIFWRNTKRNNALFPRVDDEKPEWMKMKEHKKNRNASNYLKGSRK